jgi:ethanolamine ammonia-lyase small subunit
MPEHRPPAPTPPKAPQDEPWVELRALTAARIALPRAGASLATAPQLDLRLAHARARDAVHAPLDEARVVEALAPLGLPVLAVASAAADRTLYLMRPDLGRRLAGDAEARLAAHAGSGHDVVVVIADGLSARAVETHARPLLEAALPRLKEWRIAPLVVVRQGRVAIGDEIARAVRADIAVVLIGERPGLSAPDSMGAYLTFKPTPQTTDAERNCISNIRPEGLAYADAAVTLTHLLRAMRARQSRACNSRTTASCSTAGELHPRHRALGALPPPLWGRVGEGGGAVMHRRCLTQSPPPLTSRGRTERGDPAAITR